MKYETLLVDVDGTLYDNRPIVRRAWNGGNVNFARDAFTCEPNEKVVKLVNDCFDLGIEVWILTARYTEDRALTTRLLDKLGVPWDTLTLRPRDEGKSDIAFKRSFVRTRITSPTTTLALEDNPYIVDMYQQLGVPVIQVPGWDFATEPQPALELPEVHL